MTPERWGKIDRLFHAALGHEPSERLGFLARECADDAPLRREVERLLASYGEAGDFIEAPAADVAAALLEEEQPGLAAGQVIGHYRILSSLGAGGMGEVHLAVHERTGRKVALKLLPEHHAHDLRRVRRFRQEAQAVLKLNHPNIVTVHDVDSADGKHFIVSEFIEGETLRERLGRGPLAPAQALDVAAQVAAALAAAHAEGVVHRDLKPENVMLRPDGFIKVLDFGLAKLEPQRAMPSAPQAPPGSTVETNPGMVMGTVGYMSPEQARGLEVDERTDIWSLGVVLYEMVTGQAPFRGETPSHVIVSILESEPPLLAGDADVPDELGRVVSKALSKDPAARYQTALDMAQDLKALKEGLEVESRLKRPRRPDAAGVKVAAQGDGRAAPYAGRRSATNGAAIAHTTSSAAYLVNGIRRHRGSAVFASVAALTLVASLLYYSDHGKGGGGEAIDSVAVLPFANAGGDPDTEYLADGISDSIIESLTRLRNLRVISLSTVLRYKGRQIDPREVGRELNVRAVLVGRMTQRGDALVVSAELVDVRDARRLWGGQYNRPVSDILAVQEEIAGEMAEKLRPRLGAPEKQLLTKNYTESTDAYQAYARGRFLLEKRTGPATEKSVEYFERAVKLDPDYAPAYAALSYAYWSLGSLGGRPPKEVLPEARAAAAKALELDDTLAETYTALGHIRSSDYDWPGTEKAYRRAVELNPNSGFAHTSYAVYFIVVRRFDEAVAEGKRAVELEPTSVHYNRNLAMMLYFARRYDEAIEQCQKTLELDPDMPTAYRWLAKSYEQKGQYEQAVAAWLKTDGFSRLGPEAGTALREAYAASGWEGFWRKSVDLRKGRAKQGYVVPQASPETYARLGEKDQAFASLEKAYEEHGSVIITLNADPVWDGLRSDPRYADLVRRMNLEP